MAFEIFLCTAGGNSRGIVMAATRFIARTVTGVVGSENFIRSTIQVLSQKEKEADELVDYLRKERDSPERPCRIPQVWTARRRNFALLHLGSKRFSHCGPKLYM